MIFALGFAALVSIETTDAFGLATSIASSVAFVPVRPGSEFDRESSPDVAAMLHTINAERAGRGLGRLALDARLCSIAESHASDMIERNYLGHSTPEGVTPFDRMRRAHYPFNYAGENLALNTGAAAAARALWLSSEHRRNILEPHYLRVGIAALPSRGGELVVEDFSD